MNEAHGREATSTRRNDKASMIAGIEAFNFRACLKSAVCRVRSANRHLKAPEGRKVCRNANTPCTQPQRGDRYVADNIKNMKGLPTNEQKWLRCRLFKQALKNLFEAYICRARSNAHEAAGIDIIKMYRTPFFSEQYFHE